MAKIAACLTEFRFPFLSLTKPRFLIGHSVTPASLQMCVAMGCEKILYYMGLLKSLIERKGCLSWLLPAG